MIDSTIAYNNDTATAARNFRKRRAHAVPSSEEMLPAWSGDEEGAAVAWHDLKQADPTWPADLQSCAARALRDEKVVRLLVEGALRAGRYAESRGSGAPVVA